MLLILTYMLIYNLTSMLLFITIVQVTGPSLKTLFSFSNFDQSSIFTKLLSLTILSLAGVPPLVGFFSKIFVFVLISNSNLAILFLPFFTLLFAGLYFYVQNLRFLHSSNKAMPGDIIELSPRQHTVYFSIALPIAFFLIFGFCYADDVLLTSLWTLL